MLRSPLLRLSRRRGRGGEPSFDFSPRGGYPPRRGHAWAPAPSFQIAVPCIRSQRVRVGSLAGEIIAPHLAGAFPIGLGCNPVLCRGPGGSSQLPSPVATSDRWFGLLLFSPGKRTTPQTGWEAPCSVFTHRTVLGGSS